MKVAKYAVKILNNERWKEAPFAKLKSKYLAFLCTYQSKYKLYPLRIRKDICNIKNILKKQNLTFWKPAALVINHEIFLV